MSKTVKKLLSVVLAVLVLAAGFSTMLGSFVMAEPEWTYDYQALIPQYVGTSRDHELLKHNLQVSDGSILVPAELGFYDIVSVATNARAGGGGLDVVEANHATLAGIFGGMFGWTDCGFLWKNMMHDRKAVAGNPEAIAEAKAFGQKLTE